MTLRVHALGTTVCIDVGDPRIAAAVAAALEDLAEGTAATETTQESSDLQWKVAVQGRGPWHVRGEGTVATARSAEEALTQTLTAVNAIAVRRTPLLAFHAAVVSRDGEALAIPGRSGAGKSTLTACLLRQGWAYVSDEALAMPWDEGPLVGYPRPMALSPWSCVAVGGAMGIAGDGETVVRPVDLGASVEHRPSGLRHVVLLERGPQDRAVQLVEGTRQDALTSFLPRGFTHHHDGARALTRLIDVLRECTVVRVSLGDPSAAARVLTEELRSA